MPLILSFNKNAPFCHSRKTKDPATAVASKTGTVVSTTSRDRLDLEATPDRTALPVRAAKKANRDATAWAAAPASKALPDTSL